MAHDSGSPPFQLLTAGDSFDRTHGPKVRLAGRRADGRSVAVELRGVFPFLLVKLVGGLLTSDGAPNEAAVRHLKHDLDAYLNRRLKPEDKFGTERVFNKKVLFELVRSADCVLAFDYYGYSERKHYYVKLTFSSQAARDAARSALHAPAGGRHGGQWRRPPLSPHLLKLLFPGRDRDVDAAFDEKAARVTRAGMELVLAEANISLHDQVMDELNLKPGGWCAIDTTFAVPSSVKLGVDCMYQVSSDQPSKGLAPADVSRAAPVRVLAWDLEVWCQPLGDGAMRFFDGDDPGARLLCVSAVSFGYGAPALCSVVFSLGNGATSHGAPLSVTQETATDGSPVEVRWFGADERALLRAFFEHVRAADPDVLTGWNTLSFDWPWLCKRAAALDMAAEMSRAARWGKVVFDPSDKARQVVTVPGREVHDMMAWTKKNRQLREYSLQHVATEYGLDGKDDVSYDQIAGLSETHEGRVKLAIYCELDSRLVCQLMQKPQLDPLGKALAIAAITGVQPEHILHRGSMHTLRLAMLRASHASGFVLSCPARTPAAEGEGEGAALLGDAEEEDESRYNGGKVLTPKTGFYRDPVVTLDFGSLYPSCMCELNICASTRLSRAVARFAGLAYTQPPAPDLTGTWWRGPDKVARVHEKADDDISVYLLDTKRTVVARYTDELNESITLPDGAAWTLEDGGYALRVGPDEVWRRADKDVLVMVETGVREGVIPMLERTLKQDRKAAKKKMAAAEAAKDKAAEVFLNNLQNGIKVLMNAVRAVPYVACLCPDAAQLYGGLGTGRGGIFPESSPLASAITARGRSLIVMVKKTLERQFWLTPGGELGGFGAEPAPGGAEALVVLYGGARGRRSVCVCVTYRRMKTPTA